MCACFCCIIRAFQSNDTKQHCKCVCTCVVLYTPAGINVAGVKWVIRLQLVLLMILSVAMLDFLIGSFVHTDPGETSSCV